MDFKRYIAATFVVFTGHAGLGYLIHGVALAEEYDEVRFLRPFSDFVSRVPLLYVAALLFAVVFCFIYTRAYDPKEGWLVQGLVYGLLVGSLLLPGALVAYVVLPLPGELVLKAAGLTLGHVLASGVLCALLYQLRPPLPG